MKNWGFTSQERRAIYVLLIVLAVGTCAQIYKKSKGISKDLTLSEQFIRSFFEVPEDSVFVSSPEDAEEAGDNTQNPTVLIDINTATEEELQQLVHIGPVIAKRIVEYRVQFGRFATSQELKKVKGIGEKTYAKIRSFIKT